MAYRLNGELVTLVRDLDSEHVLIRRGGGGEEAVLRKDVLDDNGNVSPFDQQEKSQNSVRDNPPKGGIEPATVGKPGTGVDASGKPFPSGLKP